MARPYFFAGLGPVRTSTTLDSYKIFDPRAPEVDRENFDPQRTVTHSHHFVTDSVLGLGLDAALGRRFTLGVRAGYRNLNGRDMSVEYGVSLGWLFGGKPKP